MMKKIFFLFLFAGAAILSGTENKDDRLFPSVKLGDPASRAQIDSVLASVNGEPVILSDVLLETAGAEAKLGGIFTGERLLSEVREIRKQALEKIIRRKLLYQVYLDKPFPVPPQEIENMLDQISAEFGDMGREALQKRLNMMGITMSKLRSRALEKLVTDVLQYQFCDKAVNITPKEVYEEYKARSEEWSKPEQINLQLLQIVRSGSKNADPGKLLEELKTKTASAGFETFRNLIIRYSDAANASEGGMTGFMDRSKLRPEFRDALEKLLVGQVAGPVAAPEAWYFLRIAGIEKSSRIPFSGISEKIRARMMEEAIGKQREAFYRKLREKAVIRYYF